MTPLAFTFIIGPRTQLWLRIFGYGFSFGNEPALFSERYGYRKCVRIFGWRFELLSPRKAK